MTGLYGKTLTRREIAARAGVLSQFAGVRLMELGDGVERGIRMLEFRTGSGLRFTLLVDRALDIGDCEHKGQAIGWHSPSGFRHPGLHEYEGEQGLAWVRSFSGLLVTCGLDHILGPEEVPADNYGHPGRKSVRHTLHGRVSTVPAKLSGYGETWEGDHCILWAEATIAQSAVFGENLHLIRRVEADVGGNDIRISDRVTNQGFRPTPHMFFYHVNVGYPLLDEGSRYLAPIRDVLWAAHAGDRYRTQGVGYHTAPAPIENFVEQVWQHELAANADDETSVALVNDRLGLGFEVTTKKSQMPCLYQWQNFQAGEYVLGIEPSTHHVKGNLFARERGEMIWLEHGEGRQYDLRLSILDGVKPIDTAAKRIASIAVQPGDPYPPPSGNFTSLKIFDTGMPCTCGTRR
ncbi:MAG: aldose 1-epimerase family protein [Aestuariivirga sp.]